MGKFDNKKSISTVAGIPAVVVLAVVLAVVGGLVLWAVYGPAHTPGGADHGAVVGSHGTEPVKPAETEPETVPGQTENNDATEPVRPAESEPGTVPGQTENNDSTEPVKPVETEPETVPGQTENNDATEPVKPAETEPGTVPGQTESTNPSADDTEPATLQLPVALEEGRLEVTSLFQSSGINPDCGNREGTDIATIALKNNSEYFLTEATVTAILADGTKIRFLATNLPSGKTAMVFSGDNISLPKDAVCVSIDCKAQWDKSGQTMPQGISASADGMMVTVMNDTAQDIPELIVYCCTPLGEVYFGGTSYKYTINDLPANGSRTFMAVDCIVGLAEVVRIETTQG